MFFVLFCIFTFCTSTPANGQVHANAQVLLMANRDVGIDIVSVVYQSAWHFVLAAKYIYMVSTFTMWRCGGHAVSRPGYLSCWCSGKPKAGNTLVAHLLRNPVVFILQGRDGSAGTPGKRGERGETVRVIYNTYSIVSNGLVDVGFTGK